MELCHEKRCNCSFRSQASLPWLSFSFLSPPPPVSRSATPPSSTAASSSTRASRCARPTTTSPVAACVRPASSPSWAAASPPWGPSSTPTTWCVTSAWSPWAKAASRSRRTSRTATPASSNSSVEDTAGLCPLFHPQGSRGCVTLNSQCVFFTVGMRVELVSVDFKNILNKCSYGVERRESSNPTYLYV